MTKNEIMLIEMVRNHPNTEEAIATAIGVIVSFLNHLEPSEAAPSVDSLEFA
jgi:hypothetical protein